MPESPQRYSQFDRDGKSLSFGKQVEKRFEAVMVEREYNCRKSKKADDQMRHFDFHLTTRQGKEITADVKGPKRVFRGDPTMSYDMANVEVIGTVNGHKGWLFSGEADYIFFELQKTYLYVRRELLADYIKTQVDFSSENRVRSKKDPRSRKPYNVRDRWEYKNFSTDGERWKIINECESKGWTWEAFRNGCIRIFRGAITLVPVQDLRKLGAKEIEKPEWAWVDDQGHTLTNGKTVENGVTIDTAKPTRDPAKPRQGQRLNTPRLVGSRER